MHSWIERGIWHHSNPVCRSGSEVHNFPTHPYQIPSPHQKPFLHLLVCTQSLETYSFSIRMDTTRGTSSNPAQAARDARDEMKSILKEIRALNEEVTQALQMTPSLSLSQPTPRPQWHPSDPLVTERQIQLAWFYDFF